MTVHMARHMEQISLPVLKLVEQKHVSPDTVVSPLAPLPRTHYSESISPKAPLKVEQDSASLFSAGIVSSQAASTDQTSSIFYAQQMQQRQPSQQAFVNTRQYSTVSPYSGSELSPIPQQAAYGVPYGMNVYPAPTSTPVNHLGTSTYPPPFNTVPRHVQHSASPAPSTTSHPSFVMTLDPVYSSQPGSVPSQMYSSPVEGHMGFPRGPIARNVGMEMNLGFPTNDPNHLGTYEANEGQGVRSSTPGFMGPQHHSTSPTQYRYQ